jgi:alkylation response protein AidB-like acyl-CoA dehydrogenase
METKTQTTTSLKGGEFLVKETNCQDVFIPEEFNEEQRMMVQTCKDFVAQEIWPNLERIDHQELGLIPTLLEKAGELGLLGVSIPEAYGGLGQNFNTSLLVTEAMGTSHSFMVAMAAHAGIGTLPILYYGNEEQKKKYLPKLSSGEWKASYCLTEPGSGSDANSGKTKAVLTEDGKHYLITGQKMWITNAGFADIFVVFAKIGDDKNLTGFIVEKTHGGITLNEEEKKMGIKGSSTRQVFFNNCKIPVENLLGEREGGFKIAVNILNIGRARLGAGAMGACKEIINKSVQYANTREQFGLPIAKFGAIRHKLAEQAIQTFTCESAIYRMGQNIDDAIESLKAAGKSEAEAKLKGVEQFAIECAILKVYGSEVLDYCADEGVQIFGGMGFSADAPMDRSYRDSRINRIFEGTNEINRLLTVDMVLKRAMKGELDLLGPAKKVAEELLSIPDFGEEETTTFSEAHKAIINLKKAVLMVAGGAVQKLAAQLQKEQELLMRIADMIIDIYIAESTLLRVEKLVGIKGEKACATLIDILHTFINDAADRAYISGKGALNHFSEGDEHRMMMMGLKRFTKMKPYDTTASRRRIAAVVISENKYSF